jgi:hypothetical protein
MATVKTPGGDAQASREELAKEFESEATRQAPVSLFSVALEGKPPVLKLVQGPGAPREYLLLKPEVAVGRGEECDVPVPSEDLSRRHVILRKDGVEVTCQDLESRNGVFLNGVRIHSAVLRDGDTLQLGNVVFLFHQGHA